MTKDRVKKRKRKAPFDSISYTTGDIELNINRFNQSFGTDEASGTALSEAKRYVRRYYIRPMNIFCSNKAEIIKALIEIDNKNCTIYTLNNLGGDKDVSKLMNSDIIYFYDDGILYDKNRVKIMDYDLSIKKEEDRKHFANVDAASDKEFKAEYKDRMTDKTELEESLNDAFYDCNYDVIEADYTADGDIYVALNHKVNDIEEAATHLIDCLAAHDIEVIDWNTNGSNVFIFSIDPDNAFDLDFDDVNVFGECLTESKEQYCCICGEPLEDKGHDPWPYKNAGKCCNGCKLKFVAPLQTDEMRGD